MNNNGLKFDLEQVLQEHGYKNAKVELLSHIDPYVVIKAKYKTEPVSYRTNIIIAGIFLVAWIIFFIIKSYV